MATGPVNKTNGQTPSAGALINTLSTTKAQEAAASAGVVPASKDAKTTFKNGKDGNYDVQISPSAKGRAEAMQKAFDIAKSTPDVREDRVAALKKQIEEGTYKVDSGAVADGMLRDAIKEHLAQTDER